MTPTVLTPTIGAIVYEMLPPRYRIRVPLPLSCGHVTPLDSSKSGDTVRCTVCKSDREVM